MKSKCGRQAVADDPEGRCEENRAYRFRRSPQPQPLSCSSSRATGPGGSFPLSVLFGGVLGLLNFRWLAIAVQRVYLRQGATPGTSNLAAVIISILKLSIIFVILFIVIKWQLLHVFGLVAGLSFCFLAIIWEGATALKDNIKDHRHEGK